MPISKLSAPQPHELVRKVNELVDALNSGGGGDNKPTGSLGVRRIDYELTADQYLQYNESTEWYTLSVPYPEGFNLSNENAVISINFVFNNIDAISMPFQDFLRALEQVGHISEMRIFQNKEGSSIRLARFKASEPTLVQDALSQANIALFVAAEVDIPDGSGGESNLKAVVINTPLSNLMYYDSDSGVYYNTAKVYLSDLGENDLAGGILVDYLFVFPDEEGNPSATEFYSIGGILDPFIKDGTLQYQKRFVLIDGEYIELFSLNSTDEEIQNVLVNEFFPYCYLGILYKVGGFDDVVDYFGGSEDE